MNYSYNGQQYYITYSGGNHYVNGIQITDEEYKQLQTAICYEEHPPINEHPIVKKNKEDAELLQNIGLDIDHEFGMMYASQIIELFNDEEKLSEVLRKYKLRSFNNV